jgi:hypothetical protein
MKAVELQFPRCTEQLVCLPSLIGHQSLHFGPLFEQFLAEQVSNYSLHCLRGDGNMAGP